MNRFCTRRARAPAVTSIFSTCSRNSTRSLATYTTFHPPRLHDRVAVITGASSGLGRAIALAYASHGAKLVVCADVRPEPRDVGAASADTVPTHELVQQIYGEGRAAFVKTDVGVEGDVELCVADAVGLGGRLDVMVNNAGLGNTAGSPLIHQLKQQDWERTMRVNSTGVYLGCKHAIGQFLKQDVNKQGRRGWIVNVSSMLGFVGIKGGTAAYCASKGAVLNLTHQIALDYAKDLIHCNALCPGFTKTAMTKANYENAEVNREMIATTPWGDWGTPEDVAKVAVFLASDDAAWVTGVGLPVDGGYLAQ